MSTEKSDKIGLWERLVPSKGNLIVFLVSVTFNLGLWAFMYFGFEPSDIPMPLHYNIYQGIDMFDTWSKLYIIPVLGLVFIFLNYLLSVFVFGKDKLMAYFLNSSSVLLQLILLTAFFWILNLQKEIF
ncbi:hypothetical protein KKC60_01415 [Patescibacteria group bacterium]|nr:hypothetical protein [Patescibacteria group bacterium]